MRIVALLAVRNEELYMERCLEHLFQQGIETCVIDNGSTDRTREIAERFIGRGMFRIENYSFPGFYDWEGLLRFKERLATEIDADWFIHQDADEIRESPKPLTSLREGIEAVDAAGYTAIDFDEFVFLPTTPDEQFENRDYVAEMQYYYYFCRHQQFRVNAWKKIGNAVNLVDSGGHQVRFDGISIFPEKFVLRHYIALSLNHLIRKYGQERIYNPKEVEERRWHRARAQFDSSRVRLPRREETWNLDTDGWVRSYPLKEHLFFGS